MTIANSRNGKAATISMIRDSTPSTTPPKKPAARPARSAMIIVRTVAVMPMKSDVRAPYDNCTSMSWPSESDAPKTKQSWSPNFHCPSTLQPCIGVTGRSVRSSVPVEFDLFSVWPVNCSNSGAAAANANSQKMNTVQPMPTLSRRRRAQACCQGLRATTPFSGAKPGAGAVRLRASAVATHELHRRMHPDPPCAADVTAHALRMPPHEAHD